MLSCRRYIVLFCFLLSPAFGQNIDKDIARELYKAKGYNRIGYLEENNSYFFQKGVLSLETAKELAENRLYPKDYIQILERQIVSAKETQRAFKNQFRNYFPLLPFLAKKYSHYHNYKTGKQVAVEGVLKNLADVIPNFASVLILTDSRLDLNYALFLLQKQENRLFYSWNSFDDTLSTPPEINSVLKKPSLLMAALKRKGLPSLHIISLKCHDSIDAFESITGTLYSYNANGSNQIKVLATTHGIGKGLSGFSGRVRVFAVILALVLISVLPMILFFMFKLRSRKYEHLGIKQAGLGAAMLITGAIFGSTVEYLPNYFFDFTAPVGYSAFLIIATGILVSIAGSALALLLLFRVEGTFSLTNQKFYLPLLFSFFFTGIGYWLLIEHYYFSILFEEKSSTSKLFGIILIMPILGFISGVAIRRLIDSRLGSGIERLIPICYLITVTVIFGVAYSLYLQNQSGQFFMLGGLALFAPVIGEPTKKFFLSERIQNILRPSENQQAIIIPETIGELFSVLSKPHFSSITPEFANFEAKLNDAIEAEGGVIVLSGDKGAGKSRYLETFFQQSQDYRSAKIIYMDCKSPENNDVQPFEPFIEGLLELDEVRAIREAQKLNNFVQENTGKLQTPIKSIPVVGWLLSALVSTDTSNLVSKSDHLETIKQISESILSFSRSLIEDNNTKDGCLIFIIEHSQFLDDSSVELIKAIQRLLRDDEISPEKNPLAFLCISDIDHNSIDKTQLNPIVSDAEYLHVNGFNYQQGQNFFLESLNFSRSSLHFYKFIFDQYSINAEFISPLYIIEYVKKLIRSDEQIEEANNAKLLLDVTPRGFKIKKEFNLSSIPLPEYLAADHDTLFDLLNDEERNLLECAAVIGVNFSTRIIEQVLYPENNLKVLQLCQRIIEKTGFIKDLGESNAFQFAHPYTRNKILQEMFIVNDDSKLIDKQIFIYLNQKILEVRERLNIGSTLARAEHAMHGGSELIDKAVEQLLLLFDKPDALTAEYSVSFFGRLIYYSYEKGMNPERLPLYFDQLILLYSKLLQIHRSMHLQETILNKFITDLPHFVKTSNNYSPAVGLALCEIAFLLERDPTAGWDKEASTVFSALFNTLNPSKTEKIKKLFWDASGLKYTNPDQAFDLLQEVANELSAESTEQDFYSRALTGMVEILYNKKDYKNAEILLEKALVAKQQLEDKQGLAILYFYRCQIYKDQALLSKAFESIDLALEFNKDIESEFGILLALKNKAEILFTTKDYSGAERCLREAIQYNDHFETRVQLLAEATVAAKMANESALQASSEVSLTKSISQNMDKVETLIEEIPKSSQKESELSSLIEERNGLIAAIYKNNLESQRE